MTASNQHRRANPRREQATRRAFILWMAAYCVALVLVATVHLFGGASSGMTIDANGVRTQQARATGEPQSSLVDRALPEAVTFRTDG